MKETIFIVASDTALLDEQTMVLQDKFNVIKVSSTEKLTEQIELEKPKSIILNVSALDQAPVQLCELVQSVSSHKPDILIVASNSCDQQMLVQCYEAGVSDKLKMPFESQELLLKAKLSVARKNKELSLLNEIKENQDIVFNTMKQASQYSLVMTFFKNIALCTSVEDVAERFFETMHALELSSSLRVNLPTERYFHPNNKEVSAIEKNVYEALLDKGRLFEFKNRLIVNDNNVSFLVKNIPQDDAELGLLRDYCAALVEGIEAKVVELNTQQGIDSAAMELGTSIDNLKGWIKEQNFIVNSAMSEMMMEIATSYHQLDMTDIQEEFLTTLIEKTTENISKAEIHLVNVSQELEEVNNSMSVITSSFKKPSVVQELDIELF